MKKRHAFLMAAISLGVCGCTNAKNNSQAPRASTTQNSAPSAQNKLTAYEVPGTEVKIVTYADGNMLRGCRPGDALGRHNRNSKTRAETPACFHLETDGSIRGYPTLTYPIQLGEEQETLNPYALVKNIRWLPPSHNGYNARENMGLALPAALLPDGRSCPTGTIPIPEDMGQSGTARQSEITCWAFDGTTTDPR